jgi:hypothetical protein
MGKFYDGLAWTDFEVPEGPEQKPVAPFPDGDGTIFVSIPSYRGMSDMWRRTRVQSHDLTIIITFLLLQMENGVRKRLSLSSKRPRIRTKSSSRSSSKITQRISSVSKSIAPRLERTFLIQKAFDRT